MRNLTEKERQQLAERAERIATRAMQAEENHKRRMSATSVTSTPPSSRKNSLNSLNSTNSTPSLDREYRATLDHVIRRQQALNKQAQEKNRRQSIYAPLTSSHTRAPSHESAPDLSKISGVNEHINRLRAIRKAQEQSDLQRDELYRGLNPRAKRQSIDSTNSNLSNPSSASQAPSTVNLRPSSPVISEASATSTTSSKRSHWNAVVSPPGFFNPRPLWGAIVSPEGLFAELRSNDDGDISCIYHCEMGKTAPLPYVAPLDLYDDCDTPSVIKLPADYGYDCGGEDVIFCDHKFIETSGVKVPVQNGRTVRFSPQSTGIIKDCKDQDNFGPRRTVAVTSCDSDSDCESTSARPKSI